MCFKSLKFLIQNLFVISKFWRRKTEGNYLLEKVNKNSKLTAEKADYEDN